MSKEYCNDKIVDLRRSLEFSNQPEMSPPVNHNLDISRFTTTGIFSPGGLVDSLSSPPIQTVGQQGNFVQHEESNISNPGVSMSRKKFQPMLISNLPRANSTEPDVYACEKSLVIDHILEKIFSDSDVSSLKNFRLVCHRWRLFGAKELQKSVSITLRKNEKSYYYICKTEKSADSDDDDETTDPPIRAATTAPKNSTEYQLENLSAIMQSSKVFPYFPCTSFTFYVNNLRDESLQSFFNTHGFHIKTLRLNLRYGSMKDCTLDIPALKNMLVVQLPLLECFQYQVRLHDGWEREDERQYNSLLWQNETEQQRSGGGFGEKNQNFNFKLKSMEFYWELPRTVFESLVRLTPNLKQVTLDSRYLNYLIEPTNRIYLLKKIMVFLWHGNLESWEKILDHYKYIQLQEIGFYLNSIHNTKPDVLDRVAAIINKILNSSCNSLEKILWAPISLLPGLNIPRMPKVKQILFGDYYWKTAEAQHFFPQSTNLSLTFPNLQTICFAFGFLSDSDMNTLKAYFNNFDPVPSVRYLYIKNVDKLSPEFREHLSNWFPNANIL